MNKEELYTYAVLIAVGVAFVIYTWTNLAG